MDILKFMAEFIAIDLIKVKLSIAKIYQSTSLPNLKICNQFIIRYESFLIRSCQLSHFSKVTLEPTRITMLEKHIIHTIRN